MVETPYIYAPAAEPGAELSIGHKVHFQNMAYWADIVHRLSLLLRLDILSFMPASFFLPRLILCRPCGINTLLS